MYDSPMPLIRRAIPSGMIAFSALARATSGLYLLSYIGLLPGLSWATISPPTGRAPVEFGLPFDAELLILPVEGSIAGPMRTAASVDSPLAGIVLGVVDAVFGPALIVAIPFLGLLLTLLPLALAAVLLSGYRKHAWGLGLSYLIVEIGYSFGMAIKSIGLDPGIGSFAAMAATALLLIAGIDRHNELGLISDNRYQLSNTGD